MFREVLLNLKNSISLVEVVRVPDSTGLSLVLRLDHHVLDSSELDDVARS